MSKRRIRGTFFALFFFAAVAVLSSVGQALTSTKTINRITASECKDGAVLTADGGDPWPRPPIPWSSAVA